ncbi:uncharacterized protein LOC131428678 [Malaya genurostris]|uniref:uncharacterized protein LOC131428678 n=1 Tax=Malaya genurostris TaxID=325434 RepID=UPI0026F3B704|nr:uncharacterized protein LOC131428678 [Malaya genurostris]
MEPNKTTSKTNQPSPGIAYDNETYMETLLSHTTFDHETPSNPTPSPAPTGEVPEFSDAPPAAVGVGSLGCTQASITTANFDQTHTFPINFPSGQWKNTNLPMSECEIFSATSSTAETAADIGTRHQITTICHRNSTSNPIDKTTDHQRQTTPVVNRASPRYPLTRGLEGENRTANTILHQALAPLPNRNLSPVPGCSWHSTTSEIINDLTNHAGAGKPGTPCLPNWTSPDRNPTNKYRSYNHLMATDVPERQIPLTDYITTAGPSLSPQPTTLGREALGGLSARPSELSNSNSPPRSNRSTTHSSNPREKNCILALQWNTNGLRTNIGDLQQTIACLAPICLAIQETHIKDNTNPSSWFGYRYLWKMTRGANIYQTVALAIRADMIIGQIHLNTDLLAIASQITYPIKCTVVSIYVPQDVSDFGDKLTNLIDQLPKPFLIMGDFNAHHFSWGSKRCCPRGKAIVEVVEKSNAIILNDGIPTFLRAQSTSAIDLTICSHSIAGSCGWSTHQDKGNSDHFLISISYNCVPPSTTRRRRWIYDRADWTAYENDLEDILDRNLSYSPEALSEIVVQVAKSHIPRTSGSPPHRAVHWWNPKVESIIKARRTALRLLRSTSTDHPAWEERSLTYRKLRNQARKVILNAKAASWANFLDGISPDSSTQEIWRRVNALSGKRRQTGYSISINGTTSLAPLEIANEIGSYFQHLSANESMPAPFILKKPSLEAHPTKFLPDSSQPYNRPFSTIELATALGASRGKSAGPDDVGYPMLHHLPPVGKRALLDSFNRVWEGGPFPDAWRGVLVIPIPKTSQRTGEPSNFRPISLMSCIAKTMERLVNRRLITILENDNLLDNRQFAFRKGLGSGIYLGCLGETLNEALSEGLHADLAILDIAKAYNTIWREGVLCQLLRWGIRGNLGRFIQEFISKRHFNVCIGGTKSRSFSEDNGVPQGSVLSVTWFLISMNSLFASLPKGVYVFVYADDIVLVATGKTAGRTRIKLQAAVNAVGRWAESVGFNISATKCSIAHCCNSFHNVSRRPVKLSGTIIPFQKEPKVLGVVIDRKLTFLSHFRKIKADCESRKRLVLTISTRHPKFNRKTALNISQALIHSKIFYGLEITSRNWEGLVNTLAPLYHVTVREAANLLPSTPANAACVEAGILPLRWTAAVKTMKCALRFLEKTTGNECALLETAKNLHLTFAITPLPEIARLLKVSSRDWCENGPNIDISLSITIKSGAPQSVARAHFNKLVYHKYPNHVKIYTDGSKLNGDVGIGVSGIGAGLTRRLPSACSIFSAEAAAIDLAISKKPPDIPTVIFSDSLSVLTALIAGNTMHPTIQKIEESCYSLLTLCWVPAHCGIPGNEDADRLASLGRRSRLMRNREIPSTDICKDFQNNIRDHFNSYWLGTQGHLQKIKGTLEKWNDRGSRVEQKALSRLRVGHTKITHAHTITQVDPPTCASCNTRLNVEHLLVNCRKFEALRHQYDFPSSIRDILSNDPGREEVLLRFLRDAKILDAL